MDIAIVGAGAMGSLFGGLLAADGADVTLINRSAAHVEAINEHGLLLIDDTGEERTEQIVSVPATTHPADVGAVDLVLLFVKSHATAAAMADVTPLLDPGTAVLTLQNGLGNAETIAEHVPDERVLAGITTHGAIREEPGRVRHTGTGDTAIGRYLGDEGGVGDGDDGINDTAEEGADGTADNGAKGEVGDRADGEVGDRPIRAIAERFSAAGIPTDVVADVPTLLWEKVLVNVGINAPTALSQVPNGALAETDAGRRLLERTVREAERVARATGHDVREDIVDYTRSVAERTAGNRSSMRQDVEAGRQTEVEALYGAVVEHAEEAGVDAPICRTLADLVRLATTG